MARRNDPATKTTGTSEILQQKKPPSPTTNHQPLLKIQEFKKQQQKVLSCDN